MSKYTTEVRFICEHYSGLKESVEYESVANVIEKSRNKVFDFEFPIYDESYRGVLETKILKHYYTREIGFETVALWKLWLDKRLNEIMPYYNQLYKSATLEFNPFYDVDLTTDSKRNINHDEETSDTGVSKNVTTDDRKEVTDGTVKRTDNLKEVTDGTAKRTDNLKATNDYGSTVTDSGNSTTKSNNTRTDNLAHSDTTNTSSSTLTAYSDTPQGSLTGVENLNYLTNATKVTGTGTETNNGTNTGTVKNDGTDTTTSGNTSRKTGADSVSNTGTQTTDSDVTVSKTGTQTTDTGTTVSNIGSQTTDGNTKNDGTRTYTNVDDYLEHVRGKRGSQSYAALLMEYRDTFLNIDMQIIDELADLFMNLW